jgi:two-component system sensor histidine kinase TctE
VRVSGGSYTFDLPGVAERALRTDQFDTIYYSVRNPDGAPLAGDPELPPLPAGRSPGESVVAYDGIYRNAKVRVIAMALPCEGKTCTIYVAETTRKRNALARNIVLSSVVPAVLIALAALSVVWFGVKRGLAPLEALSEEIRARSARDLRPIDLSHSPDEAKPLVQGLNQLLGRVDEANRNQQRFLANAAHQLRTPLAGLQAHTELALAQPVPEQVRAELEHVHGATVRTARLASQLLALARVEPGGRPSPFGAREPAPHRRRIRGRMGAGARSRKTSTSVSSWRMRQSPAKSSCCAKRTEISCTTRSSTRCAAGT